MNQDFVNILQSYVDKIVHDWALLLKGIGGKHFARCTLEEIEGNTRLIFEGYMQVFREGKPTKLRHAIRVIARQRGEAAFCVSDIQRAFLVFKDIARSILKEVYADDTARLINALESIDLCVATAVAEFSEFYEQVVNLDIARLEEMSMTDPLTRLINWGAFHELLDHETARSLRYGSPVSLSLCDLDHFKRINDTYGHPVGDTVLQRVAAAIKGHIRGVDIAARYGGEEFALIFPETDKDAAFQACEKLRHIIEQLRFEPPLQHERLTMSFGIASLPADAQTSEELIEKADNALYAAKNNGRNCVCRAA
ncbi:MAG: GGDEF domain-containing protein [Abditibacteriales bacterium]|nr:GGDEF domain-containing protein [Abditibacteriales bacterium]MDW8365100.1 GGDEF domain-containing protein [Abditibacteriales bacterium]